MWVQVRHVIDEVIQGQLTTVLMQTAHREPDTSLLDYYAILPKLQQLLGADGPIPSWMPPSTLESMLSLERKLQVRTDASNHEESSRAPPYHPLC